MPSPRKGRSPARGASKSPARSSRRQASKSPARSKSDQKASPTKTSTRSSKSSSPGRSPSRTSKRSSPARSSASKVAERPGTPNRNRSIRTSPSPTRITGRAATSSVQVRSIRTVESSSVQEEKASKLLESEMERGKKEKEQLLEEARSRLNMQSRGGLRERVTTTQVTTTSTSTASSQQTSSSSSRKAVEAPKTVSKEFGGTIGTFLLLFLLPATVYYITFACNEVLVPVARKGNATSKPPKMVKEFRCSVRELPQLPDLRSLFSVEATLLFLGWFFFQALLAILPIGRVVDGQRLANGQKLKYRCNGLIALLISVALFGVAVYKNCPVERVYDLFPQLLTAATVFSVCLSIMLYIRARLVDPSKLAPGGNTGSIVYDFFIGHELNPRIASFDLKFFCELRPGLIGWVMLNLVFMAKAFKDTGSLHPGLALVSLFQFVYVADALVFEEAILTTMDIIHDGFGFMLVFGDLVWVPFLYCLQTRFLLMNPVTLPWYALAGIALLDVIGFIIFRGANSEKNEFRKNPYQPRFANMETVKTSTGRSLLAGGWWGICRKPNYLGDLLMATAWCLPCGFQYILPYFYPLYFLVLLIHRERRDDHQCLKKYGSSWKSYCQRVRYRIFPGIY